MKVLKKEENILFDCDEEIFNRIHKIIKQHINDFNSIYELLVSAKFLTKKSLLRSYVKY